MGKRNGNAFDLAAGTATAHEEIEPGFVDWPPIGCEIENGCENHAEKHLQTRRLNGRSGHSGRQKNGPEDVERVPQLEEDNSPTKRSRNEENLSAAFQKSQSVRGHTGEDHEIIRPRVRKGTRLKLRSLT